MRARRIRSNRGALRSILVVVLLAASLSLAALDAKTAFGQSSTDRPNPTAPTDHGKTTSAPGLAAGTRGAPPGYGLIDASRLQPHGPIYIGATADFTLANGVRQGIGTRDNPFVIRDWIIDGNLYPTLANMITIMATDRYVVLENIKITNLDGANQWSGIKIGEYWALNPDNPVLFTTKAVTIRHNEIQGRHAYGIWINEDSWDIRIEANLVSVDANRDWVYGIGLQRNVHNSTIYGNYVEVHSTLGKLTVGIQVGDYEVVPDRAVTGVVIEKNTVTNATAGAIVSDDTIGTIIKDNLIFHNFPGINRAGTWPVRGIQVEEISRNCVIFGNEIHHVDFALMVASPSGTYFGNVIHDVDFAVYIYEATGFKETRGTADNVIFDTEHWNVRTQVFRISPGGNNTVLDVGPAVTPTDFTGVFFVSNKAVQRIAYDWSGRGLNVSMALGARIIYDRQQSSFSQELHATWQGAVLSLNLLEFTPRNVRFSLSSGTGVGFSGTAFVAFSTFSLTRGTLQVLTATSNARGNLSFAIPFSSPAVYGLALTSSADVTPPLVHVVSPGPNSTTSSPSVQFTWTAEDPESGIWLVGLTVDSGTAVNVSGLTNYTVPVLAEGIHVAQIKATDNAGLSGVDVVTFRVDSVPPRVSIIEPAEGASLTATSVTLRWSIIEDGSGIAKVEVRLDTGEYVVTSLDTHSFVGLAREAHVLAVKATDRGGLTDEVSVRINAGAPGQPPSGPAQGATSGVTAVSFVPSTSSVEIHFAEPMNETSVEVALRTSPSLAYDLIWLNNSHLAVVFRTQLEQGRVYQVTLNRSARDTAGDPLPAPFTFQFDTTSGLETNNLPSGLLTVAALGIIAAMLAVNWATAGILVVHYKRSARRLSKTLGHVTRRLGASAMLVYRRVTESHASREEPRPIRDRRRKK